VKNADRSHTSPDGFEQIEKRKPSPAKKILIAILLLSAVFLIQHFIFNVLGIQTRQDLIMTDTEIGISYSFDMSASFYSPGGRFFFFGSRDGMQYISSTGEVRWQHNLNISQPVMIGRGDIAAIWEPDNHRIYVFGPSGLMYEAALQHPVLYFTVNQTGYLSVITRTGIGYEIHVFNPADPHNPLYGFRAPINDANVFPMSVDVSDCGTYVVKALLDVNVTMLSRLTFSYIRRVDSPGTLDGFIASYQFPDEFIIQARFVEGNRLLVLTDQQIRGFDAGEGTHNPQWNVPLYNQPDQWVVGQSGFAFVTGDAFLNQPEADDPGVLYIYNFNGQPTGTYELGRRATHLSMGHGTALVGMGRTFYAISAQGTRLWTASAIQDVHDKFFLDNTDAVLLVGGTRAAVMRRLRSAR